MARKVVFFELNEVPYRVIENYCDRHPQSWLAKALKLSHQYETFTADTGFLAPTKSWPTVHRGVNNEKHGLTNFGQPLAEVDRHFPSLWQLAAAHGKTVGVFGSLFSYPISDRLEQYAFYMPDSFASEAVAQPTYLESFQNFNLSMSRASSRNVSAGLDVKSAVKMIPDLPKTGLNVGSFWDASKQLVSERINPKLKTRRRTLQAMVSFDIFLEQLRKFQPQFATFFTNNVAATMHRYWAAAYPDDYRDFQLTPEWVKTFGPEIDYAMAQADRWLGQLFTFADRHPEYVICLITSMGQAATIAKPTGGFVGIADLACCMQAFGLTAAEYEERPAMAPIHNVMVASEKREAFRQKAATLTIADHPIATELDDEGFFQFDFTPFQGYEGAPIAQFNGETLPFSALGLDLIVHEDGVYLTADHIPQGALLCYDPQHQPAPAQRTQISVLDIAPSLLKLIDVPIPAYMNAPMDLLSA
jgi:hypothetical protein